MEFSSEQRKAIDTRGTNILLSAAAGSGKTTVLVERVLQLILNDNASIDRMLVVTFTKASAGDMREKLQRNLAERAADDPRFQNQLLMLNQAHISTLHSFCSDFLRRNFEAAQVDPAFEILDTAAANQLRDAAIEAALEDAYERFDEDQTLRDLDYGRTVKDVRTAVLTLMQVLEARPDPEKWLKDATSDEKALTDHASKYTVDAAHRFIQNARNGFQNAVDVPNRPEAYDSVFSNDIRQMDALLTIDDYAELCDRITNIKYLTMPKLKKDTYDEDAKKKAMDLRNAAKKIVAKAAELFEDMAYDDILEDMRLQLPQLRRLAEITLDAVARFDAAKEEIASLTYNDLEHRTLLALRDPAVAEHLRESFDYIFIDEYQDTSDIQEAIVKAFARADNVFTVGDVKQSIYRFRNAEPNLFLEKGKAYERGEGGALLHLTRNFRSKKGILDFINMIFRRTMIGGETDILYDKDQQLNPGSDDDETSDELAEIHLINKAIAPDTGDADTDEALQDMNNIEREGIFIAQRIQALMLEDPDLHYGDIAVICRSRPPFASLENVLIEAGIPAFADGVSNFFGTLEITYILTLLQLIANPRLDVEMLAVLRSPMVGLSAEQLAQIRIASPKGAYVNAVEQYAKEQENDLADTLKAFLEKMALWALKLDTLSLGEFVRLILDESGYYTYVSALPGGAQRQANLDLFVADACAYDAKYSGSLTRFLKHTEYLAQRNETEAAKLLTENDDVVRLMTIHHSKGLEYPVVFCPCLDKAYHKVTTAEALIAHKDIGFAIPYYDQTLRTRRSTITAKAIIQQQKIQDRAEELRLLYVMLTRAKTRLILSGTIKKPWEEYAEALATDGKSPVQRENMLDVILAALQGADAEGERLYCTLTEHTPADFLPPKANDQPRENAARLMKEILKDPASYEDAQITAAMSWEYPYPLDTKKPLKLTVSGLVRELDGPETIRALLSRPQFMQEDSSSMTGTERGTAYHRCLELLELEPLRGLNGQALEDRISERLEECVKCARITRAQVDAVRLSRLAAFIESDIGQRLIRANTVRREWSFNAILKCSEALTAEESAHYGDADLLVQGTIDCCFLEDDQWVLLDYKTDRSSDLEALKEHYRKQLKVYALALEKLTGRPVKQSLLCLLGVNKQLDMDE